jgi:hypothetical protein
LEPMIGRTGVAYVRAGVRAKAVAENQGTQIGLIESRSSACAVSANSANGR